MSEYKIIPSFPMFEINDEETMDKCIRTVDKHEYLNVYLCHGYPQCYLCKKYGGDGKHHFLHRLICETYIGDIPEGYEIDHLNRNISDYRHENLKICSHKENLKNPLTRKYSSNSNNFRKKIVQQIDIKSGRILNEYLGIKEAGRLLNIDRPGISACCNKRCKTYKGFIWKFKE